jgi:hypothetical protein
MARRSVLCITGSFRSGMINTITASVYKYHARFEPQKAKAGLDIAKTHLKAGIFLEPTASALRDGQTNIAQSIKRLVRSKPGFTEIVLKHHADIVPTTTVASDGIKTVG